MKLTAADIAEISRLLDDSHFSDLQLQMGDFKLRISRGNGGSRRSYAADELAATPTAAADPGGSPTAGPAAGPAPALASGGPGAGEVDVPAPLLGNFYTAPRPGDDPFVQPGDSVGEDTTIGIIEVMKLMNPIRAGVAGTVVGVLAENGSAVAEGQALIRVKAG